MSEHIDHISQSKPGIHPFPDRLHVVTVVTNPCRYRSRYNLYRGFEKHMADSGVVLYTVELAFGGRAFEITSRDNPRHIQLRADHELWHKENLLNLGIRRLPPEAKYIATVDADFTFIRPDWAQETLHQLQHHPVVQMYSEINHLSHSEEVMGHSLSYVEGWNRGKVLKTDRGSARSETLFTRKQTTYPGASVLGAGDLGSPGGAWAYRRAALDGLGGLIDYSIVGSADYYMAASLYGMLHLVLRPGYHPTFNEMLHEWQTRAVRNLRSNVGVVPGLVLHHWHGKMSQRGYGDRERLMIDYAFNPARDIKRDSQGVIQLEDDGSPRFIRLRDGLRAYFRSRNEDTIE